MRGGGTAKRAPRDTGEVFLDRRLRVQSRLRARALPGHQAQHPIPEKDTWQMISGRVESGETGWEVALTEIEEETGLVPGRFYSTDLLEQFYEPAQNCVNSSRSSSAS